MWGALVAALHRQQCAQPLSAPAVSVSTVCLFQQMDVKPRGACGLRDWLRLQREWAEWAWVLRRNTHCSARSAASCQLRLFCSVTPATLCVSAAQHQRRPSSHTCSPLPVQSSDDPDKPKPKATSCGDNKEKRDCLDLGAEEGDCAWCKGDFMPASCVGVKAAEWIPEQVGQGLLVCRATPAAAAILSRLCAECF